MVREHRVFALRPRLWAVPLGHFVRARRWSSPAAVALCVCVVSARAVRTGVAQGAGWHRGRNFLGVEAKLRACEERAIFGLWSCAGLVLLAKYCAIFMYYFLPTIAVRVGSKLLIWS